ncbi:MAG: dihydrolipoyl dehydrogenase [Tannerellaceae bacterium]|jgi:dihydrolipoamide dehydrogenase|nr:dihydrolipoyl dehydrogenase [Tannerellaceae bacterium]
MKYDVAIIGGGPAGYTAAQKAGAAGRSTILFEKNALGGVCLNEGCIPTKTILYSAKMFDTAKGAVKYGVGAENVSFDLGRIMARKQKVVRKLTAGIRTLMSEAGVAVVQAEARIQGRDGGTLTIAAGDELYEADRLILCTGSETFIPPIPGLEVATCWTSREALMAKEMPASLVVIGGGVIGMEFASFFNSLGTEVSVVEMLDEILPGMDREAAAMLRAEYTRRGVAFHTGCRVTGVDGGLVEVAGSSGTFTLRGEKTLASVGRRPVLRGFGLETLGLETKNGGVCVDAFMRTSVTGVYACGDITGRSMLAHTAVAEAETAVAHILGRREPVAMSYHAIPAVVYTNPEIAGAGATEEVLREEGRPYTVRKVPMTFSGRFVAENEMGTGMCKMLLAEDETLLGVHLVGNPASELITIASIAIGRGMKAGELASCIFPHPTVSEIMKEALG